MAKSNERELLTLIDEAQTIGLVTHIDGDGDAFGSMLGLARILKTIGKKVIIFSSEPLIDIFDFLKDEIGYAPQAKYQPVELLIGLDGNFFKRFSVPDLFDQAKSDGARLAIIDHHQQSDVGDLVDLYWCEPGVSSASEMVYRLTKELNLKLDKTTATILLMGIETDTNSLQFENSKPETFLATADLLNQGAKLKSIMASAFSGKSLPTVQLLGRVLDRARISGGNLVVSYITLKDKEELGMVEKVSSGVANFLEQADEGKVTIVFEEIEDGLIKGSIRANNSTADVSKFANFFGGGGHKKASGFKFIGTMSQILNSSGND